MGDGRGKVWCLGEMPTSGGGRAPRLERQSEQQETEGERHGARESEGELRRVRLSG